MEIVIGQYVRDKRMALYAKDRSYSLRQVAMRIGIEPSYLSKVERGERAPLSEEKIIALAEELGEDKDVLLAMSNKVGQEIQEVIRKRPRLFAQLLRELKDAPDHAVVSIIREVRDGKW
ncbi:MAG: helix-turn-helix domain-containing protein [Deltaproteobacteria bacterium]|nr:helix-turn-helix domain-containing protein [Deltaproteobacteria bacterium]